MLLITVNQKWAIQQCVCPGFFGFSFLLILSHIHLYVVLGPGVSSGEFKKFVLEANLERKEAGVHQDS